MKEIIDFVRIVIEQETIHEEDLLSLQKRLVLKAETKGLTIEEAEILKLLEKKTGIKIRVVGSEPVITRCWFYKPCCDNITKEDIEDEGCCAFCENGCNCDRWINIYYNGETNYFVERNKL